MTIRPRVRVVTKIVVSSTYIDRVNDIHAFYIALFTMSVIGFIGWLFLDFIDAFTTPMARRLYFVGWIVVGLTSTFFIQWRIKRWLQQALNQEDPTINYTEAVEYDDPPP